MAGNVVATLVAKLEADIKGFESGMKKAETRIDGLEASTGQATAGMGKFGAAAKAVVSAIAAKEVLDFAKNTMTLAVNAEEAGSMFATTFGPAVDDAQEFVDEMANKMGMANWELQQLQGVTANTIQGLGATEEQSRLLSERMVTLAGDVGSFANADPSAVLAAMGSAINGEREALKTYGLAVSEAEVNMKAFQMTGKTSVSDLTRLEKATATVEVAFSKAGKAIGDLDRTASSTANQQRQLSAVWKEAQVQIGAGLTPAIASLIPILKVLATTIGAIAKAMGPAFGPAAMAGAAVGLAKFANAAKLATISLGPLGLAVGAVALAMAAFNDTFEAEGPIIKKIKADLDAGKISAEDAAGMIGTLEESMGIFKDPVLSDFSEDWKLYVSGAKAARDMTRLTVEELEAFQKFHSQKFTDPFQLQFQLDAAFINMDTGALRTMMSSLGAVGTDEFTDTFQLSPAADDAVQAAIDAIGLGEAEFQKAIQNLLKIQRAESNFQNNLKTLIAAGLTNTAAWLESRNDPVGAQLLVDSLAAGEGWAEQLEKSLRAGARDAMNATREVIGLDKWLNGWKQLGTDEGVARGVKLFNAMYKGNYDAFRAAKPIATIGLADWLKGWASLGTKEGEARNKALREALKGLVIPPIPGFGADADTRAGTRGGRSNDTAGSTIVLEVDGRQLSTILRTQTRANTLNGLSP